jgi:hypothetical protein
MNREDIIRMAREAGCKPFRSPEHWDDVQVFATPNVLERFAELVAAAEREACARVCEEDLRDEYIRQDRPAQDEAFLFAAIADCAEAIRARGGK